MIKYKQSKSGFSLAEVLIAVALIGIIAAVMVPTMNRFKPNKNKAMFRKAYQQTERIVYELINDKELYPDGEGVVGFDNVTAVKYNGATYGDKNSQTSDNAKCKFMQLFALKLNTLSQTASCSGDPGANISGWVDGNDAPSTVSFTTTDGIMWALPKTNFTGTGAAFKRVIIDVNGNKPPNKMDYLSNKSCKDDVDRFSLYIMPNGNVDVYSSCAVEYMRHISIGEQSSLSSNHFARGFDNELPDGPGHVAGSVNEDVNGDGYFDGDTGNCDPTLLKSDPNNSGCY